MKRTTESIVNLYLTFCKFMLPARRANPSQTPFPFLPDELVAEILSWLPVKSLMRFRCVCKTWYSLIFHPTFVKLHLQRSPRDTSILLTSSDKNEYEDEDLFIRAELCLGSLHCCSVQSLLKHPSSAIGGGGFPNPFNFEYDIVGVCNGLVCLCALSPYEDYDVASVRLWNPATRMRSEKLPCLQSRWVNSTVGVRVGLGYDDSNDIYKVVAVTVDRKSLETELRVFCLGENIWRKVASWHQYPEICGWMGQFVSGTLNSLATLNDTNQYVIFSFDVKNETYKYLSPPQSFVDTTPYRSHLAVLRGCLCLYHNPSMGTHFFLWQMKEFGVEESWTRLMKVSYEFFPLNTLERPLLSPLWMSENGDVLFHTAYPEYRLILYNLKDNRVSKIETRCRIFSLWSRDYVQSLILPYRD